MDEETVSRAVLALRLVERVAVLTGAGISAESGLKTFRDSGGLWEGYRPEEVATPEAFAADPELVWRFYNARRAALWKASPNPGHVALVELAGLIGHWTLITQNVDRLHQRAGSRGVIELHGNLEDVRCPDCSLEANHPRVDLPPRPTCPRCGALLRPAVVWFGEALPTGPLLAAQHAAAECEVFLVVGTSAVVYPAAGLAQIAHANGASIIEINLVRTEASDLANIGLYGRAGEILPEIVRRLREASTGTPSA